MPFTPHIAVRGSCIAGTLFPCSMVYAHPMQMIQFSFPQINRYLGMIRVNCSSIGSRSARTWAGSAPGVVIRRLAKELNCLPEDLCSSENPWKFRVLQVHKTMDGSRILRSRALLKTWGAIDFCLCILSAADPGSYLRMPFVPYNSNDCMTSDEALTRFHIYRHGAWTDGVGKVLADRTEWLP